MLSNTKKITKHFRFPFKINHGMRLSTDALLIELNIDGVVYKGEATFPPYILETQDSALNFLNKINWSSFDFKLNPILNYSRINSLSEADFFAKAMADMVLWDVFLYSNKFEFYSDKNPLSFYTISICEPKEMKKRFEYGFNAGFRAFKLKLNGENDENIVQSYRELSNLPFAVDVNSGWKDFEYAFEFSHYLREKGCILIEQPFSCNSTAQKLKSKNILPIIADESFQLFSDLNKIEDCYNGGNIKLLKCGGLSPGLKIAEEMKKRELKVLIGCMSEGKIGCNMAAHLSGYADWVDLDGPWLLL